MPLRDYRCECGHRVDDHLEDQGAEALECPECGEPMARAVSRCAVVVKGSSGPTIERADWGDYSHTDMADTGIATEAAYDVARKSGIDEARARASAAVAGEAMQRVGATLIENQAKHATEIAASGGDQ